MTKGLWEHRYLIFFGMMIFVTFLWEVYSPDPEADISPNGYPDTIVALYPQYPKNMYFLGLVAMYEKGDIVKAKEYFEAAIKTGDKTNENLFLQYARCLYLLNYPDDSIEQVIKKWKINFPHSNRKDPRTMGKHL